MNTKVRLGAYVVLLVLSCSDSSHLKRVGRGLKWIVCNVPILINEIPSRKINQRTSGPVNAHLIPGPGIYFNAFVHVYSPRTGADNPLGDKCLPQRKALITLPICCKF